MRLTITELETGFIRIQGEGPCNWWQGERFPCSLDEMDGGFFDGCSGEFQQAVHAENRERREDAACDQGHVPE